MRKRRPELSPDGEGVKRRKRRRKRKKNKKRRRDTRRTKTINRKNKKRRRRKEEEKKTRARPAPSRAHHMAVDPSLLCCVAAVIPDQGNPGDMRSGTRQCMSRSRGPCDEPGGRAWSFPDALPRLGLKPS